MIKKLLKLFVNLLNPAVSVLSFVDYQSSVDRKAHVWRFVKFTNSSIGKYSYVGPSTRVVCADIGKFCAIAGDSSIGLGTHALAYLSISSLFTSKKNGTCSKWTDKTVVDEFKRISIGNDVWIGTKVIIMGGVTIGDGAVIGAGSIVTKDVPSYAVVAGVPAKVIKYRFEDDVVKKLSNLEWWNLPDHILKKNIALFQKSNWSCSELNTFDYA